MYHKFLPSLIALMILLPTINVSGQKEPKPYKCGFIAKDISELTENYEKYSRHLGVQPGEIVASVGASNGYIEVQISSFIDSIQWTIQDIDTTCLNHKELNQVISYHEQLINKKLNATFHIIIGSISKTNLPAQHYDRVLLVNVFHELTEKKPIMSDISDSLKEHGVVVVMERMATKPGQKHGDCKHPKLLESEFFREMSNYGFDLMTKVLPDKKTTLTFYTFRKS